MRLVMIDIVHQALLVHPTATPTLSVDDLSEEPDGKDEYIIDHLGGFTELSSEWGARKAAQAEVIVSHTAERANESVPLAAALSVSGVWVLSCGEVVRASCALFVGSARRAHA